MVWRIFATTAQVDGRRVRGHQWLQCLNSWVRFQQSLHVTICARLVGVT